MTTVQTGTELARVTISGPKRRVDVVLPAHVPAAEFLAMLLRRSGDELADIGATQGGWALRRADGEELVADRPLISQNIRDGEVLYLVSSQQDWPELEYDDIAEAIAAGSERYGGPWTKATTRATGLSIGGGSVAVGLPVLLTQQTDWFLSTVLAGGMALLLLAVGLVAARAIGDSAFGAVFALLAQPYAAMAGLLILADDLALGRLGAPHLLLASVGLLVAALLGSVAVGDHVTGFAAGITTGLLGALAAGSRLLGLSTEGSAAVLVVVLALWLPAFPLLAMRFGKLPMPDLPANNRDLLRDEPPPPANRVYNAVVRSDDLLTGMLLGAAGMLLVAAGVLVAGGSTSALLLVPLLAAANLLRARAFTTIRHRLPLLAAGLGSMVLFGVWATLFRPEQRLVVGLTTLIVIAAIAVAAGLAYSRRQPNPYLGRAADWADVLALVAIVPVAFSVLGIFGFMRGLGG